MFLLFLNLLLAAQPMRVCADPANLPFSNRDRAGFDNRIAGLIAHELHRPLDFVWMPETKHFVRKTLEASKCDVLLGVPEGTPDVLTSQPYYRSSYVFVSRGVKLWGLDDPALRNLRIGVPIVGDDYAPPAAALARRGLSARMHGYPVKGTALFHALHIGEIDVAVAWGPAAGYAAKQSGGALVITQILMRFALTAAVRKNDGKLKTAIDDAIARESSAIRKTLDEYGVPVL